MQKVRQTERYQQSLFILEYCVPFISENIYQPNENCRQVIYLPYYKYYVTVLRYKSVQMKVVR